MVQHGLGRRRSVCGSETRRLGEEQNSKHEKQLVGKKQGQGTRDKQQRRRRMCVCMYV
jgi:hypothetical protein